MAVVAAIPARGEDVKPRLAALAISEPITIDGELEESAWQRAEAASEFTQREPHEGTPATERTEVRVVYTRSVLYLSVHAFDSEPERVIAKEMERDATLYRDDAVVFVLDTFGDHRNGYAFETNPNGARFDALVTDEGRDVNVHWDGVWDAAGRRTADGWSAELAIPFSTVRFDPTRDTWGLNVRRMIRRKNEEVHWAPLPRSIGDYRDLSRYAVYRISMAGELTDLHDLAPSRRLGVTPFLVGDLSQSPGTGDPDTEDDTEAGLDVKWGIGRGTSLDLTYNTDFAEVEVDQQQVNLTRFSLFFPEKRDFFLENAGIFEFGLPNRETLDPALMKVFFSRRIGLEAGREVPIDYGVRLTGRERGWNLGVLGIQTDDTGFDDGFSVPQSQFGVLRLKRNLGGRSGVGLLVTDREDEDLGRNTVYGADFDWKPTRAIDVEGFASRTDDDRIPGDDWSAGWSAGYRAHDVEAQIEHLIVNEGYQPGIGFLLRRDFEHFAPKVRWRPRIEKHGIRSWYFEGIYDYYGRASVDQLESRRFSYALIGLRTMSDHGFSLNHDFDTERLFAPFEIRPGIVIPAGVYDFSALRLGGRTNEAKRISMRGRISSGDFFDGTRDWLNVTIHMRGTRFFNAETLIDWNDVDLKEGAFVTKILGERLSVTFTPDLRVNAFLQYNDAAELVAANVRFNWIYRPGADLFLVYNETWDAPTFSVSETRDRQLIMKVTYLLQR
ncbi:MAG TPA: DUF5916 domain-containing protein [Thermoanaerobaculia bacterium]|nr:DUF5916 domain-containing protein [Thermoanaerobaculia bacterium]